MKALLRRFKYIRDLEDELDRTRRTLASASRYVGQLEGLRAHQEERIGALEAENKELRHHLSGGPA